MAVQQCHQLEGGKRQQAVVHVADPVDWAVEKIQEAAAAAGGSAAVMVQMAVVPLAEQTWFVLAPACQVVVLADAAWQVLMLMQWRS